MPLRFISYLFVDACLEILDPCTKTIGTNLVEIEIVFERIVRYFCRGGVSSETLVQAQLFAVLNVPELEGDS